MSPFDLPPWMLWGAALLIVCALIGLVGGTMRNRRPAAPAITFQPFPIPGSPPTVSGKPAKAPAFVPPAPLASIAPDDGSEQRCEFRRPGNPVLVQVADADQQRSPWNAWVVDRSRRGIRLAVERPLLVGNVYTVRPIHAPPATPWTALEVRHCTEIDDHWEAGCRFLQPPSVAVMMLYG